MWDCSLCSVTVLILSLIVLYKSLMALLGRRRISSIDSRYVFITGCDTGFGHLAAKRLDALGCHVIAGCLTERGEEELRKTCSSRLATVHLDVSNHECRQGSRDSENVIAITIR